MKTEDGSVYMGSLSTAESLSARPVKIQVVEASGKELVIDRGHNTFGSAQSNSLAPVGIFGLPNHPSESEPLSA